MALSSRESGLRTFFDVMFGTATEETKSTVEVTCLCSTGVSLLFFLIWVRVVMAALKLLELVELLCFGVEKLRVELVLAE